MKTNFLLTVCAASLLAFCPQFAMAQQPPSGAPSNQLRSSQGGPGQGGPSQGLGQPGGAQPQGQPGLGGPSGAPRHGGSGVMHHSVVAVIDLNKVMNEYVSAKKQVEALQKAGMDTDNELRKSNAEIEMLKEKLKDFKPGTEDFKRREEEITQRMSDLKVKASFEQRDFQEKQMKAMYFIYREISAEVERYAQANGIALVMDYPSEKPDITQPTSIQRAVTKPFVYQGGPDITDAVLASLNQRALAAKPAGGPGAPPPNNARRQ